MIVPWVRQSITITWWPKGVGEDSADVPPEDTEDSPTDRMFATDNAIVCPTVLTPTPLPAFCRQVLLPEDKARAMVKEKESLPVRIPEARMAKCCCAPNAGQIPIYGDSAQGAQVRADQTLGHHHQWPC